MKLTNEEIAKVFAMYWGCPIDAGLITVVDSYWIDKVAHDQTDTVLKLTPLSKISNEDAIEVSNQQDWKDYSVPLTRDDKNGIRDQITACFYNQWVNYTTYEYLKIKGYAVPLFFAPNHWANGKTAIELGIAIDKTL